MNRYKAIRALWLFFIILLSCLFTCCDSTNRKKDVEKFIIEGARQWADSVQTGDTKVLEQIIADDFIGIDPEGNTYDKVSLLSHIRSAPSNFLSNSLNDVKVSLTS